MSRSRESLGLTVSQLLRYKLPVLAICITSVAAVSIHGQKVSGPASSATASKSCDGQMPSQTSSHQGSPDPQSATEGATDRLKLSTKGTQEPTDAEGQFCKRERPSQNSLRPSVKSSQADETSEPAQPAATPIAQLTNGKLIIRANGQDFAAVLESIRSVSGFTVEMPPGGESEPVFLNMGPASVTDALVALIDGTNYNYFIVGSAKDPQVVKRLILTERAPAGPATLVASTQGATVASQPTLYGSQGVQADTEAEASEPPPPPSVPTQPSVVPSSVPTGINIQQLAAQSNKTPGQILDELQKRQQQVLDDQAASQSQSAPQQ